MTAVPADAEGTGQPDMPGQSTQRGIAMTSEDVKKYLDGLLLPAAKNEIKGKAKHNGAPKDILKEFDKLPWLTYQHESDIEAALKKLGLLVG